MPPPTFRLYCPTCSPKKTILIRELRFSASAHPLEYIVCKTCGWAQIEGGQDGGIDQAARTGRAIYDADLVQFRDALRTAAEAAATTPPPADVPAPPQAPADDGERARTQAAATERTERELAAFTQREADRQAVLDAKRAADHDRQRLLKSGEPVEV